MPAIAAGEGIPLRGAQGTLPYDLQAMAPTLRGRRLRVTTTCISSPLACVTLTFICAAACACASCNRPSSEWLPSFGLTISRGHAPSPRPSAPRSHQSFPPPLRTELPVPTLDEDDVAREGGEGWLTPKRKPCSSPRSAVAAQSACPACASEPSSSSTLPPSPQSLAIFVAVTDSVHSVSSRACQSQKNESAHAPTPSLHPLSFTLRSRTST
jgi:hypothetical protein